MRTKARLIMGVVVLLAAICIGAMLPVIKENNLPKEAVNALDAASAATLYSLQPEKAKAPGDGQAYGPFYTYGQVYNYHVLARVELHQENAQLAINEFKNAAVQMRALLWKDEITAPLCCAFNPSYALQVTANGHTYDFLICYECAEMEVFRDSRRIASLPYVEGAPRVLNALLAETNRSR